MPSHALVELASLLPAAACLAASPPQFRVTDLGVLPGGTHSAAKAINDLGVVVGLSTGARSAAYPHAVAWIDGAIVDLTGLGISGAVANAVSNDGQIVGISDELGLNAFVWQAGEIVALPGPFSCCSEATGINGAGTVVGRVALSGGGTPNEGAMWVEGELLPLPSMGFQYDVPSDINNSGIVVGTSYNGAAYRPVRWSGGGVEELPSFGGFYSEALAINDAGLIVGHSHKPGGVSRAVAWTDGAIAELPALSSKYSMAAAVNEAGWIVGVSVPAAGSVRAVLWIDGVLHDLAALVVNGSPLLFSATGINEQGQIVGEGEIGGELRAYLLTPVDPADFNADGLVDGADLGALLSAWGPCAVAGECPADLTGDAVVDGADLGALLASWG